MGSGVFAFGLLVVGFGGRVLGNGCLELGVPFFGEPSLLSSPVVSFEVLEGLMPADGRFLSLNFQPLGSLLLGGFEVCGAIKEG